MLKKIDLKKSRIPIIIRNMYHYYLNKNANYLLTERKLRMFFTKILFSHISRVSFTTFATSCFFNTIYKRFFVFLSFSLDHIALQQI